MTSRRRGRGSGARYSRLELLDLRGRDLLELGAHRLARFELLASRSGSCSGVAASCRRLDVAEERQRRRGTAIVAPSPIVFSQPAIQSKTSFETLVLLQTTMNTGGVAALACLGVLLPESVVLLVVAVEAVQRALQLDRQVRLAVRPRRSCGPSSAGSSRMRSQRSR